MEKFVKIEGIHCNHCIEVITKELLKNKKIKEVKIKKDIAKITYTKNLTNKEIIDAITKIDYITKEEYISDDRKEIDSNIQIKEFLIIICVILFIWFLLNKIFGFNIFQMIPNINSNITYGMLFVTGLLTSIHCISMCGAINLMAIVSSKRNIKKPLLYNTGRVLSYTIIGGMAGLLGNVISINDTVSGVIIVLAAILMFLMSLSMLGIISIRFQWFQKLKLKVKSKNSFLIGLLNGLMPCGPLQAMQVYALSTASFLKGALSMFLFGLGTVPLMMGIGLVYNVFKGKRKILINKIASVLIMVLSIVMLNRGLLTLNVDVTKPINPYGDFTKSEIKDGYQVVEFDLDYNEYEDIIVQKDIPVKMIIHVDEKHLTGCNNEVVFRDFELKQKLEVGENIIEFTPTEEGTYIYTCWMGMIKNNLKVVDDEDYFKEG